MRNNQYYKEKFLKIIGFIERNKRIIKLVVTFIILTWYFLKFKDIRKQLELLKATNDYNSKSLSVGFEYGFVFLATAVLVSIFLLLVYRVIKEYINKTGNVVTVKEHKLTPTIGKAVEIKKVEEEK